MFAKVCRPPTASASSSSAAATSVAPALRAKTLAFRAKAACAARWASRRSAAFGRLFTPAPARIRRFASRRRLRPAHFIVAPTATAHSVRNVATMAVARRVWRSTVCSRFFAFEDLKSRCCRPNKVEGEQTGGREAWRMSPTRRRSASRLCFGRRRVCSRRRLRRHPQMLPRRLLQALPQRASNDAVPRPQGDADGGVGCLCNSFATYRRHLSLSVARRSSNARRTASLKTRSATKRQFECKQAVAATIFLAVLLVRRRCGRRGRGNARAERRAAQLSNATRLHAAR